MDVILKPRTFGPEDKEIPLHLLLRRDEELRTGRFDVVDDNYSLHSTGLEVSGRKLREAKAALRALRAQERAIQIQLETADPKEVACPINVYYAALQELHGALVSSSSGTLQATYETLIDSLAACVRIRRRTRRLIEFMKAVKRAFRRRSAYRFCGPNSLKRIWFLMHGSNPPPNESMLTFDSSFGMA